MANWLWFCFTLFSLLDSSWQSNHCLAYLLLWQIKWDRVANQSLVRKSPFISDIQCFFHSSLTKASHMVNWEGKGNFNMNQEVERTREVFAKTQKILPIMKDKICLQENNFRIQSLRKDKFWSNQWLYEYSFWSGINVKLTSRKRSTV